MQTVGLKLSQSKYGPFSGKKETGERWERLPYPTSWAEITPQLFRRIFKTLYSGTETRPVVRLKLVKLLVFFTWNPVKTLRHAFWLAQMPAVCIYEISEKLKFLWEEPTTTALIKSFRHRGTRYHLPADYLEKSCIKEFTYADSLLQLVGEWEGDYRQCPALDMLVATLCRPAKKNWKQERYSPGTDGDIREPFNEHVMELRAKKLAKLPLHYKLYVLHFFVACKSRLLQDPAYKLIFPKAKKNSDTPEEGGTFWQLLNDVAGTKLYGNYGDTGHVNLHLVLTNLQDDLQKQQKANRNKKK